MEIFIECEFCSWKGIKNELEKNGHCPNCQSPSTKRYNCKHIHKSSISGIGENATQKCNDCLTIIYINNYG